MTLVMEESRSSLETKLYVMPKKNSALSWVFCLSWLTVYTSVMESTAETKPAPHTYIYSQTETPQHLLETLSKLVVEDKIAMAPVFFLLMLEYYSNNRPIGSILPLLMQLPK